MKEPVEFWKKTKKHLNRNGKMIYNLFIKERKGEKMKWYVKIHDFNSDTIVDYNIFNSVRMTEGIQKLFDEGISDYDKFVKDLDSLCKYCFWSKSEYEVMMSGLFDGHKQYKIDVYSQLAMNMNNLADYILRSNM